MPKVTCKIENPKPRKRASKKPSKRVSRAKRASKKPSKRVSRAKRASKKPSKRVSRAKRASKKPSKRVSCAKRASKKPSKRVSRAKRASKKPSKRVSRAKRASKKPSKRVSKKPSKRVSHHPKRHGKRTATMNLPPKRYYRRDIERIRRQSKRCSSGDVLQITSDALVKVNSDWKNYVAEHPNVPLNMVRVMYKMHKVKAKKVQEQGIKNRIKELEDDSAPATLTNKKYNKILTLVN